LVFLIDLICLRLSRITLTDNGHRWTICIGTLILISVLLSIMKHSNTLFTNVIIFSYFSAIILAFSAACLVMDYIIAGADFPLVDTSLRHIDRSLGFDWYAFNIWVDRNPVVGLSLQLGYASFYAQIVAVVLMMSIDRAIDDLAEFVAIMILAAIVTTALSGLFPATGEPGKVVSSATLDPLLNARSGSLKNVPLSSIVGIVTFPSFHAAMAVAITYSMRRKRWILLLLSILNTAMLASTPTVGGHYLADAIAGGAVACASILATRLMCRFQGHRSERLGM
jgi:PAP2 superfamily